MHPSCVASLLARVEFVKFVDGKGGNAEEGIEEDLRVFVVVREDGIRGERGEQDVDDGQCERWLTHSGSKVMGDGGIEFVCATEVKVKVAATSEFSGTQGALVVVALGMKDDNVVLAFSVTDGGEMAVTAAEDWLGREHILVGGEDAF